MSDSLTHTVTVTVTGKYPHGQQQVHASVTVAGDGSLDHMIDAFQAALVAAGFATDTAGRIGVRDE